MPEPRVSQAFAPSILHSKLARLAYGPRPVRLRKHETTRSNQTFVSPSPSADRGVIVKRINYALLAFATFVAIFTLAGCGDNKQVAEVKALAFSYPNRFAQDPNLTVDQALDTRNVCDSVKWVAASVLIVLRPRLLGRAHMVVGIGRMPPSRLPGAWWPVCHRTKCSKLTVLLLCKAARGVWSSGSRCRQRIATVCPNRFGGIIGGMTNSCALLTICK
jgi:hypothetical protein